ncbi:MAG: NUDIX domain-containing protein, partial [Mollicutes bacterium]|nr:NUDIX domain-containing protein [Mollicutes bacterium]
MKRNREYIPYLRNLVGHKEIRATGVTALIINEKEEVLLEKRSDNSLFSLPGGALDRDETIYEG